MLSQFNPVNYHYPGIINFNRGLAHFEIFGKEKVTDGKPFFSKLL